MAAEPKEQPKGPTAEQQRIAELEAEIARRNEVEAEREALEQLAAQAANGDKMDETVPGGYYLVNGVPTDANGDEIKGKK